MNLLQEELLLIVEHHRDNPGHGLDCACMDEYIQRIRNMTTVTDAKVQQRIDYVIRKAIDNRR